ncbi:MAG TPA: type I-MYXAN CRISPR-associated protein Cas6/Cmx6 [Bacillota bacterium]|nr:type I-MYXAN CRISPR-associated protein Cas6/Cmx6 [Bacillota bacterium]
MIHNETVRLKYPLIGATEVQIDHSEALYAALSRIFPFIHQCEGIQITNIKGLFSVNAQLHIGDQGSFIIQSPIQHVPQLLRLAGKSITIQNQKFRIGIPEIYSINFAPNLVARIVCVKGKQCESEMFEYLVEELKRKHGAILHKDYELHILRRRIITIHNKKIVGFGVAITNISSGDLSIALQADPPSGRKKYGCGYFLPYEQKRFTAGQALYSEGEEFDTETTVS